MSPGRTGCATRMQGSCGLKQSGMRWTVAITALRCREASSQWEEIWQRPRNQTATA